MKPGQQPRNGEVNLKWKISKYYHLDENVFVHGEEAISFIFICSLPKSAIYFQSNKLHS
jgi:hypothetical protein